MTKLSGKYAIAANGNLYDTELKRFVSADALSADLRKKYDAARERIRGQATLPGTKPARKPSKRTQAKRAAKAMVEQLDATANRAKTAKTAAKAASASES